MKSISQLSALEQLIARMNTLYPDSPRRWGRMSAAEMLCHLGDATDSVLGRGAHERDQSPGEPATNRPVLKWIALRSPLPWPQGKIPTPPDVDPQAGGTRPGDFEADRRRAIEGLRAFAAAKPDAFAASHGAFGRMTVRDWHRWAYRHTDHHLRQFGL